MAKKIYIRPSFITKFDECPAAADLQYNQKISSNTESANLVFGTAVHDAIGKYVIAQASGLTFDPVAQFVLNWDEAVQSKEITYNSTFKADDLKSTGEILCRDFPSVWLQTGLMPLIDEQGLVVERKLTYEILPNVFLTGTPDVVAMNADGEILVIDFKTPANTSPDLFFEVSDQLTAYQILVEKNPGLGAPEVTRVGFMELLKKKVPTSSRGTGPVVTHPLTSKGRRTQEQIEAFTRKVEWIVDDMRKERYPQRPRMAYNTPCGMCCYRAYCHEGDTEGLIFPSATACAA